MDGSPDRYDSLKEALLSWMVDNKEVTLIEEGKDILNGMETLLTEDGSEVSEDIIKDTTEMITTIVVCRDLELVNAAPIFQQVGKVSNSLNRPQEYLLHKWQLQMDHH